MRGAAWSVPVVAVAGAAPALAASLRKDPGINGWVLNTSEPRDPWSCDYRLTVSSDEPGVGTDGAPFGLYIYDTNDDDVITNAQLTYWIEGRHNNISWTELDGHSDCWDGPVPVGTEVKPDGIRYTGYRWTYTCPIDPTDRTVGPDDVERVFLGDFVVRTSYFQSPGCYAPTYWTQRHVTINNEIYTFQRRNGRRGPYPGGNNVVDEVGQIDTAALDAQIADLDAWIAELEAEIAGAQAPAAAAPLTADDAAATAAPGTEVEATPVQVDTSALEAERDQLVAERATLVAQRDEMVKQAEVAVPAEAVTLLS